MNLSDYLKPDCALFLDFDGTLVDIAPRPEAVVVPVELIATLRALQTYLGGAVAVISGRPIDQIDALLSKLRGRLFVIAEGRAKFVFIPLAHIEQQGHDANPIGQKPDQLFQRSRPTRRLNEANDTPPHCE